MKTERDCNSNLYHQPLSFARVLPPEGSVEGLYRDEAGKYFLRMWAPRAEGVSFIINEEEWKAERDEDGIWSVEYPFRTGIRFVQARMNGTDVILSTLPIGYGYSRPYNYVILEDEEETYSIRNVPHGSLRREYFFSETRGEWDSCMVYTPEEYDRNPEVTYPVLYLQHGHGENEVGWSGAGKVNFILDNLIAEGKAVPFVVVMCNGMVQKMEGEKRLVDFRLFEDLLLGDVIPFIEGRYHVGGDKSRRGLAGLSMGSLQTCMIGFSHPDMFSCLGIFSGFLHNFIEGSPLDMVERGPGSNEHLEIMKDGEAFAKHFSVFFRAMGKEDPFWNYFEKDDRLCEECGIGQVRRVYEGTHDWNVWRRCIMDFAQVIFRKGME